MNSEAAFDFNRIMYNPLAVPVMLVTPEKGEQGVMNFNNYFNKALPNESAYFRNLKGVMDCVQANADKEPAELEKKGVCRKEFKALRISAIRNELMYHHVNRRWFGHELAVKNNEAAF